MLKLFFMILDCLAWDHYLSNTADGLPMSQTKTCPKCGGVMKLKNEIQEGDPVSEITPLDRTFTCSCGHMEVEA